MTLLEVRLPPDQLVELADLIASRVGAAQSTSTPLKLAYSIPEAAEVTGMSEWCIRTAIRSGELHAKQAGGRGAYAIPEGSLRDWLHGTPTSTSRPRRRASGD